MKIRTTWRSLTSLLEEEHPLKPEYWAGYKGEKERLQEEKNQELDERNEERKRRKIVDDAKREENLAKLAERAAAAGVQPRRKAQFGKSVVDETRQVVVDHKLYWMGNHSYD